MGYSRVQKGYRCYCPTLRRYFVSTDVTFFETTPFSLLLHVTNQGDDDDLLVYIVFSPVPNPVLVFVTPPITQVYSVKVNVSVLTQSLRLFLITVFRLPLFPLLHP